MQIPRRGRRRLMKARLLAVASLLAPARCTHWTNPDGTVERVASTTRKWLGARHVDLDVSSARLVDVEVTLTAFDDPERFRDAVVLLRTSERRERR